MEQLQTLETYIINSKRSVTFISIYVFGGTLLTIISTIKFHSLPLSLISLFIFWICPFIFQKQFRSLFTRKATVQFCEKLFSIEIFDRKTGELVSRDENRFEEIKSFKALNSSKDDSSYLKINFKNGSKVAYTFLGQGKTGGETDITKLMVNYVHSYNDSQIEDEKITLIPNLFASRAGSYYLAVLTILLITAILFQATYKPKTIPYTLFAGIVIYLQILAQRKRDLSDLENFKKR